MFGTRDYKVYLTSESATLARDLECPDDDTALEQARRLFPYGLVELWQGNRLVARIDTQEPA